MIERQSRHLEGREGELLLQEEMEIVFMVVFTTEMLTKILALGFMLHKGSYMRNPWNFMDFFVVTSG